MPLFRMTQWIAADVEIKGCTACGHDHSRVRFARFRGLRLTHGQFSEMMGVCPNNGEYLRLEHQTVVKAYN